jgi:N-[(2S)-2-amino-2-carboxyethyl]-L-glutamate dehydrogenase
VFSFHTMGGKSIRAVIEASRPEIVARVRETYLAHDRGETISLNSQFLRFPAKPNARIISLPAFVPEPRAVAGIKWIASFPDNVASNVPRASAVLLLNDFATGFPFACLEAAQISAARTAASAALGAEELHGCRVAGRVAVVGAGVISRTVVEFLRALDWAIDEVAVFDTVPGYAGKSARHVAALGYRSSVSGTLTGAVAGADLVILATTATAPHITDREFFTPDQTVLNISLRDLGPDVVAASHNIVDDIGHCLNAGTSPHLAAQKFGHHDFIDGTIAQLLRGDVRVGRERPRIFSPFGLGVLDVAVGLAVFTIGAELGAVAEVPDFFAEVERW